MGNFIGTNAGGGNLGNDHYGVLILRANNTVSGANIIGHNDLGIDIAGSGATGNVVLGNFIGTNASGAELRNAQAGVVIEADASLNTVGPGNTIGFGGTGVEFNSGEPRTSCWVTSSGLTLLAPIWPVSRASPSMTRRTIQSAGRTRSVLTASRASISPGRARPATWCWATSSAPTLAVPTSATSFMAY